MELARRFAIVTPYTSYLIVEDEARRGVPVAQQTFQMLERDKALRGRLSRSFDDLSKTKDGYAGAWNARSNSYFKNAEQIAAPQEAAKSEAKSALAVAAAPAGRVGGADFSAAVKRLDDAEQQTRWVAGKAFTQNGSNWSDSTIQSVKQDAKRNRVQFASKEYFDLLASKPESAQWLALGRNVQFTLGSELYEVFE